MVDKKNNNSEPKRKSPRAGLLPYIVTERGLEVMFMVATNPKYGGDRPMISKGKIEDGESEIEAAIREAEEELGLVQSNMKGNPKLLLQEHTILKSGRYDISVFAVEVESKERFGPFREDETERVVWLTPDEFENTGRKDHIAYVNLLAHIL